MAVSLEYYAVQQTFQLQKSRIRSARSGEFLLNEVLRLHRTSAHFPWSTPERRTLSPLGIDHLHLQLHLQLQLRLRSLLPVRVPSAPFPCTVYVRESSPSPLLHRRRNQQHKHPWNPNRASERSPSKLHVGQRAEQQEGPLSLSSQHQGD